MAVPKLKVFEFDKVEIGEELGSYEYVLTQEMLDRFRLAVDDPGAAFPTLAVKHDVTSFAMVYEDNTGAVNAGNELNSSTRPYPEKRFGLPAGSPTNIGVGINPTWSSRPQQ